MSINKLLEFLSDGKYHSGVEMGEALGVSRTAVWKALTKLEASGIKLEVIKGKGYRIVGGIDLLNQEYISQYLEARGVSVESLTVLQNVDSTNSYLMSRDAETDGFNVCLAEQQASGRGRRGRAWHSPYAKNIYLSMSFGLSGGAEALEGLSLALGVAVANCLSDQGVEGVGLKWPNDIWVGGKKLAGILVELKGEAEFGWKVVAGLGVNVSMTETEGVDIGQPWTSIENVFGGSINRSLWASLIIESLINVIRQYRVSGLSGLLEGWSRFDILKNQEVVLTDGSSGICQGVDHRGRLLVSSGKDVRVVNAGEVSVRPNEPTN